MTHSTSIPGDFATRLISWQRQHGRHDLPWQASRNPYHVWLSEIMLQQTQVVTVIAYYLRFLELFPTLPDLAAASQDQVLAAWSGLGYYSRARNLHRAAQQIMSVHGGKFPQDVLQVAELPGIGPSTAAAICAFSFGQRHAILDGNVKRVLCRFFGIDGFPGQKAVENQLWQIARQLAPLQDIEAYTQAQMDLGATVCTRGKPQCQICPLQQDCVARQQGRTATLPTPRPKKAIPERETVMLLISDGQRLLLQKRPPTGIWGGMWSFPEIDSTLAAENWCLTHLGLAAEALPPLAEFVHVFTHFRLTITPLPMRVAAHPAANESGYLWLTPAEADAAGIPAPVRKILANVHGT